MTHTPTYAAKVPATQMRNTAPAGRHKDTRLSVGFILANRFTLCAFANFVDVLRLAADEGDRSRPILCNWTVLSDTMEPVASSCGVMVQPNENLRLTDPTQFDYIVVVGGLVDQTPDLGPACSRYLQEADAAGIPLIGVCTGVFFLHQADLLNGYRCCVSWFHHADFMEQFEGLNPVADQIFVVDRNRITCSGGASSAHLAAYLVEKHVGRAQASKSLHIMIIDDALKPEMPQPGITLAFSSRDPIVRRALLHMQQTIDTPITIDQLSRKMGHSKRQIERHFRSALNVSPQAAYLEIRLSFAHHLVTTTHKPVSHIALDCGFCDSSHLSRSFKKRYGVPPQSMRQTASDAA